ncbi:hypothetical protein [Aliiroseovarius sp. F20344]|uniref:hypothetical protein n=1 Tax=Aliiroseovarius sp. F20344 TaxID=2926414 RepID=UPI001FF67ADC|nr:hypothetical protein [Aliiroseovarius sp. F20344]MCK0143001.1 hypothetical protein [Aliiroseovarius sp. F20344]
MIGTNICIIDDGFMLPAVDANLQSHSYFSGAALKVLTAQDWDKDHPLKELCDTLVDQRDENQEPVWSVAGFRLPEFFKRAFEEGKYRSDLIVFDWEYGDEVDQVSELKFILENSHAHVIIFTGADKDEEIRAVLEEGLSEYSSRIELLDKETDGASQHQKLKELLEEKHANNFSFKFGSSLRSSVNRSLDGVLHKLSALDLDKVVKILAAQDNDPIDADLKEMIGEKLKEKVKSSDKFRQLIDEQVLSEEVSSELLEIVAEVIKTDIASLELEHDGGDPQELDENDIKIMEQLWSYRLYHRPADNVVRGGDIILPKDGDGSELFLVLTPPCDLAKFWNKTDGKLAVVKLELLNDQNQGLRERAKRFKKLGEIRKKLKPGVSSLTNGEPLNVLPGRSFLIPLVPLKNDLEITLRNYRANSHSLSSIDVPLPDAPAEALPKAALRYDHLEFSRVTKLSDPFCGAIIGATLSNLSGWGVADYPRELSGKFGQHFSESLKDPANG